MLRASCHSTNSRANVCFPERCRSQEKLLMCNLLKRDHVEEDSLAEERHAPPPNHLQEGLCRVCLKPQAWEQPRKRLLEDKHRVHGGDCHLRSQWDALQKSHKSTSGEPACTGDQQHSTAALATENGAIPAKPLCLGLALGAQTSLRRVSREGSWELIRSQPGTGSPS